MKILLLGKNGQLGWEMRRTLAPFGQITALDYEELNLEDFDAVQRTVRELGPQMIVNAAAYTAVDRAESEREKAYAINATVPGILAAEARALNACLVHYSTDYVFDGSKGALYTEEDQTNPLNVYGASKLAGEQAIQASGCAYITMRTSWVYSLRVGGFVNKVLEWARQQETMRVVSDQVSSPTWARMLAEITTQVLARGSDYVAERSGLYHLAGLGHTSRLEWTRQIIANDTARHEHKVRELLPAATADFPSPAVRPLVSAMDCSKFERVFGLQLPAWDKTLALAQEK
jgi:dTDP-4-dehydrorhamnose reductase